MFKCDGVSRNIRINKLVILERDEFNIELPDMKKYQIWSFDE